MKKTLLIGLFLLQIQFLNAQINKEDISFEVRYPITMGDNFLNKGFEEGYKGLIDIGVDYNLIKRKGLGVGLLLNSAFMRHSALDINLWILSTKLKVEYEVNADKISIVPQMAIGYSNFKFKTSIIYISDEHAIPVEKDIKENQTGITFKAGTKIVLNSSKNLKWYASVAYEFTRLEKPNGGDNSNFNRNIQLFYPGIGVIWRFGK